MNFGKIILKVTLMENSFKICTCQKIIVEIEDLTITFNCIIFLSPLNNKNDLIPVRSKLECLFVFVYIYLIWIIYKYKMNEKYIMRTYIMHMKKTKIL